MYEEIQKLMYVYVGRNVCMFMCRSMCVCMYGYVSKYVCMYMCAGSASVWLVRMYISM